MRIWFDQKELNSLTKLLLHLSTGTFGAKDFLHLIPKQRQEHVETGCRMFLEIEGCLIHGFPCGISLNYGVSELFSLSKKDEENVKIRDGEMPCMLPCD